MCAHISANYSVIYKSIKFIFINAGHLHVLYILFNFQINIFKSFEVINLP